MAKTDVNDIVGKKFGRLHVCSFSHSEIRGERKERKFFYECLCDCGQKCIAERKKIKSGNTRSCGCLRKELVKSRRFKHGKEKTRLYRIWQCMKARCFYPKYSRYKYYGGRGITMCKEWKNDFKAFYDWSMANGYKEDLTIDRIDVNGNYEPSNCRWATLKEQANNRQHTRLVEYGNEIKPLSEWCEIKQRSYRLIYSRIFQYNWDFERAFNTPKKKKSHSF